MSTTNDSHKYEFGWNELVPLLFAAKGITDGLWHVGVRLRFAGANAGPTLAEVLPSGIVGMSAVTLVPVKEAGPLVYDAKALASVGVAKSAVGSKAAKSAKSEAAERAKKAPLRRTARKAVVSD